MSEKTLKFGDIAVKKNHTSKQAIALNKVNTGKIVVSYKFKHSVMVLNILLAIDILML